MNYDIDTNLIGHDIGLKIIEDSVLVIVDSVANFFWHMKLDAKIGSLGQ